MLSIVMYNLKLVYPVTWIALAFGALVGSFLNVCILRIPEGTFFKTARSQCPKCGTMIPFWHNIPIISYLFLRGKAACCGEKISVQYPLVELFTMLIFPVLYWQHPFILSLEPPLSFSPDVFIRFMHLLLFTNVMIVVSVIDIRLQIIPDVISLPMILLSCFWVFLHPDLRWQSSLLGIVVGGGILYIVAWVYYIIRKDYGLGFGDVKLLAGIGGWLGVEAVLPSLFVGSILGSLIGIILIIFTKSGDFKQKIPFGPFLGIGAVCHMLFGQEISDILFLGN